ncbi:MAG: plasmid pRiA4b ORF-3 family protein, partial [Nanoarchaeota archaeon]
KQDTGKSMLELFDEHADLFDSSTKGFTLIIDVLESIVKQLRIMREVSDELNAELSGFDEAGFTKEAMKRILPRTAHLQKELKKMQGIEFNMMLFALPDKKGRRFYELVHELEEAGKLPVSDPAKKERIDNVASSLEQYISEIKEMSKPFVPSEVNPDQTIIFKVMFRHRKGTWRNIELRAADSLEDLHNAIQQAMGWDNDHLYSFFMDNKFNGGDFDMEYTCPYEPGGRKTADKAQLGMFGFSKAQKFAYLFDFGDNHQFEIEVLDFGIADARKKYPLMLESKGKAPEQYRDYDE